MQEAVGTGAGLLIGIVIAVLVGAVMGWIASLIVKGHGSGFWTNVFAGIAGSVLARVVFQALGIGTESLVVGLGASLAGAVVVLLALGALRRA